jgi:hypothetical protein
MLSEISVLSLDKLNWITVKTFGLSKLEMCNFSSCLVESKIIVFGGVTTKMYKNADIYVIELD